MSSISVQEVPTSPIEGMKPGTSGLRKKVEVWQQENYVANFIQSLLDTAVENNQGNMLHTLIVAGDGRYFNTDAIQIICHILAGNGVANIWIPQMGIMTTPAVSAAIRRRENGKAQGGILLTASHNPGGPGQDFGIKYNEFFGQPAPAKKEETEMRREERITFSKIWRQTILFFLITFLHDFAPQQQQKHTPPFVLKNNNNNNNNNNKKRINKLYQKSLEIKSFKTIKGSSLPDIDLNAPIGTTYSIGTTTTVTIIDPFDCYIDALKSCFDFDQLKSFVTRDDFSLLFDGMHGAGGPFAQRILVEELGLPESSLLRCNPLPDFGTCHPDPNLTYAAELVKKMGLNPDGSSSNTSNTNNTQDIECPSLPTLGAANDGDGDRNLIAGASCFVTPSDSLALICDHWEAIPYFAASENGPRGVARSMPSSAALDVVAEARGIPCFCTPTGWKFFGNLMSSKELFGKTDYSPFLCGEESFGTGSDHIREKDGLWAVLAWISILRKVNEDVGLDDGPLVGVKEIVMGHWAKYGRHFYCRYDYEGVESDAANKVMDLIRDSFVNGDVSSIPEDANTGIKLIGAEEFTYEDPVDGSITAKQGLILTFTYPNNDDHPARVVYRLSGTGSAGATIRMYIEKFEKDTSKHMEAAPVALKSLADFALVLVQMKELTGRAGPTVIT